MKLFIFSLCLCLLYLQASSKPGGPIATFLQTNVLGFPVLHAKQSWTFEPDLALRKRPEFIEKHGDKGDKLIERLGSGSVSSS